MQIRILILLVLVLPSTSFAQVTALHFGRAWLGPGRLVSDAVVLIEGTRILSVGEGRSVIPRGARIVDLTGFTGIPGLIDAHTHLTFYWDRKPGTGPRSQLPRHVAVTVFLAQENARRTLETGVTTVRNLGAGNEADIAMRTLISSGAMIGPRMFVSGQGLGPIKLSATDAAGLAEQRIKAGSDWVKVFASMGSYDDVNEQQTLSFDVIKAAVDAAHALGKPIAVHSYGAGGARDAVTAGADSIEHAVEIADDTLTEMAMRQIFYVPTIDHNRYYIDAREEFGFPDSIKSTHESFIARNLETTRRAHAMGVPIAMGSDAVFTMFGQNTRELSWFVKAGMTNEEALTAATVNGAKLLRLQHSLGQIAPGYLADIVAVKGNPASDVTTLFDGVRWVMKEGSVVLDKR